MKRFVGLDGCKTGWVAVWIGGDKCDISHVRSIEELNLLAIDIAMIDMPIGLPPKGHRTCDLLAKKILARHHARVFTGARRPLLDLYVRYGSKGRAKASGIFKEAGDHGISCQLWCIVPKMQQVDDFISHGDRRKKLREVHPELVFQRLAGGSNVIAGKKTPEGQIKRKSLLVQNGFDPVQIDGWLNKWRLRKGVSIDDVLDACACAIAARDTHLGCCVPEENAPADAHGLPMQIWY